MELPGMSVWMWGPTVWALIHTVAAISDSTNELVFEDRIVNKAQFVESFFLQLQPLLPCRYCKNSYGPFLEETLKQYGKSMPEIVQSRSVSAFAVDLHNKVNAKLARQRWQEAKGVLRARLAEAGASGSVLECLDCDDLQTDVLGVIDKKPTAITVFKRYEAFDREPVSAHAAALLFSIFAHRSVSDVAQQEPLRAVLASLCVMLPLTQNSLLAQWSSQVKQLLRSSAPLASGLQAIYCQTWAVSEAEYKEKEALFISSSCGAGTCK